MSAAGDFFGFKTLLPKYYVMFFTNMTKELYGLKDDVTCWRKMFDQNSIFSKESVPLLKIAVRFCPVCPVLSGFFLAKSVRIPPENYCPFLSGLSGFPKIFWPRAFVPLLKIAAFSCPVSVQSVRFFSVRFSKPQKLTSSHESAPCPVLCDYT